MRKLIIGIVMGLFLLMVLAVGVVRWREREAASKVPAVPARLVAVTPVATGTVRDVITATATVEPFQQAELAPEVQGTIRSVLVREGDLVRAGQVLARIDPAQPATQVAQLDAAVAVARANAAALEHQLANATTDLARTKNLFAEGVETRYHLDQVQTQFNTLSAQRELARAQVRQAEAALESARLTLGKTTIVAPFAGVVAKVHRDAGNLAQPGVPVLLVQQNAPVKVSISVPARALPYLKVGSPVSLTTDLTTDSPLLATVTVIAPALDAATQSALVEVQVPNHDGALKPGMFATVAIVLAEHTGVVIPCEAVFVFEEKTRAVLYDPAAGVAHWREVTPGLQDGERLEILAGLTAGEQLITAGQREVNDGDQVRLATATAGAATAPADTAAGQGR
ncbi:MAG TPA: efflux RND transporter periplasmic adaptor subunit [bacterium]|nr:efflux RND transporter periplasmic adaptor subunit [bacterium]